MDKSHTRKDKIGELWKAKFDEMFKVSQKLALENQKQQQELAGLRGKKPHQVLGGPKFAGAFSATAGYGQPRATGGFNVRSVGHGGAGALLEDSGPSQTTMTSASRQWSRHEPAAATFEQGNLFMKNPGT